MTSGPFFQRILDRLEGRGLVHPRAARRMAAMGAHGVHPEQVALGAGLVDLETYGSVLAEVSGLPFRRIGDEAGSAYDWPDQLAREGSWPLEVRGSTWTIGFIEPTPTVLERVKGFLQSKKRSLRPAVILRTDWRRVASVMQDRSSVESVAVRLFDYADRANAMSLRLVGLDGETVVLPDGSQAEPIMRIPSDILSALRLRLERQAVARGWTARSRRVPSGWWIQLVRNRSAVHPAEWSEGLRRFEAEPRGLLVIINPDTYLEHHLFHVQQKSQGLREEQTVRAMPAFAPHEQEEVLHTALYGHPVVALTDGRGAWWDEAVQGGVPVTLLRGRTTRHGRAWESFTYA